MVQLVLAILVVHVGCKAGTTLLHFLVAGAPLVASLRTYDRPFVCRVEQRSMRTRLGGGGMTGWSLVRWVHCE